MRTTVTLEKDVAAALESVRRERGLGLSEAVNELIRRGLLYKPPRKPFVQKTSAMGPALIDVTNVAEAIAQAEAEDWR
ncbi:MAG: ribbon-helix-helix protein, CopG family [Actinobacteria bacterium]|nr:ribbon-helix-helix protein, CopG family [Actinomycetota bacterium]